MEFYFISLSKLSFTVQEEFCNFELPDPLSLPHLRPVALL